MPIRSKAQLRFLFANPHRIGGPEKLQEWIRETPNLHALPERVGTKSSPRSALRTLVRSTK